MKGSRPTCSTGKYSYSTEKKARDAVVQIRYTFGATTLIYVCPECYQYHLTTKREDS